MPIWAARISYAERFGIEPHKVNPPLRWWYCVQELDRARRLRDAREYVDKHTYGKSDSDTQALYDELVRETRKHG